MSARAMWKAELCLASQRVPVKLYAAVQDRKVHFRLLHATDMTPVEQRMVDPWTDRVVPREELERGVKVDRNLYVLVRDQEREALTPEPSRAIVVEQVVEPDALDLRWFDRPYYLGPDADEEGYFALARALAERQGVGIARWVMRKKRYQGALQSRGGYLMLETLRHTDDMVVLERLQVDPQRKPEPKPRHTTCSRKPWNGADALASPPSSCAAGNT